jgi:phospholipid/cholesterol/gamma-HCH transport system substrate-binding protein
MTTTKQQKVRLGIFAVATGVLLVIVLAVFGGLRFWKARDRYYVEFETSVYGLEKGADVFFNGIRVGKVGDIGISRTDIRKVRVALDIDEGTPVRTDTKAMLQLAGITGLKVIDLRDGTLDAPQLAEGATIPAGATMFDKLEEKGMAIIDETQRLVERANTIVEKTDSIVTNLAEATDTTQLSAIVEQTRATAANLAQASASLKGLVDENRAGLRASIAAIEATARRAADLVDGNQVKAAVSDLRQASRSFKELAREVRQKPSRLLYSKPEADRKLP